MRDSQAEGGFSEQNQQTQQFIVNMEASNHDFNLHVSECNKDFRENIMKKIHVIKLKDTSLLNKKVSY